MKIVASVGERQFLVSASEDELAKLIGYSSTYAMPERNRGFSLNQEIKVADLWRTIEHERSRPETLKNLADGLRQAADNLDAINASVATPIIDAKSGS